MFDDGEIRLLGSNPANIGLNAIRSTEDKNVYLILDENATPLGTITVPEGVDIDEIDILDNLVPLGGVNVILNDDIPQDPYVEANPKTGDDFYSQATLLVIASGALVLLLKARKRSA